MSWAAANATKAVNDSIDAYAGGSRKKSSETVEAALSRLTKAYTSSMECVAALNKTNSMLQADHSAITEESMKVLERVANAARSTLENAVFLDPLVLPHIPTLHNTMRTFCERNISSSSQDARWSAVLDPRPEPPILTSAAHKTSIRELAYLALVNYSDLLYSCSIRQPSSASSSILERGVVQRLQTFQERNHCCWQNETKEDTYRLAVTALCDASKLDNRDPTIWLKLACASRSLEIILQPKTEQRSKHRSLQRYALECGSQALPPHVPPNRTVARALKELMLEAEPLYYESIPNNQLVVENITVDLPRYSWSTLGRMVIRASKEGTNFQSLPTSRNSSKISTSKRRSSFGSPRITMTLSPMLVLPSQLLGNICLFLGSSSIWRFEATCKALSVSIMSARAALEDSTSTVQNAEGKKESARFLSKPTEQEKVEEKDSTSDAPHITENTKTQSSSELSRENARSSRRIRSQQITSGKKSQREAKRRSFEYCFLAATTNCTAKEHATAIKNSISENSMRLSILQDAQSSQSTIQQQPQRALITRREELESTDSSLKRFVEIWSNKNSGPFDLMMKYLLHIARNVEDVFTSESGGGVVLTSCILSCFEAVLRSSGYQEQFAPKFYRPFSKTFNIEHSIELFSLDLLYAELILKQCDRYKPIYTVYDDHSNLITIMVPELYSTFTEIQHLILNEENRPNKKLQNRFAKLTVRCNWLFSGFYLWKSRSLNTLFQTKEAEEEGLAFIDGTIDALKAASISEILQTPHLVSPNRIESHWKELTVMSLLKYRNNLQAASIISVVREEFQDLLSKVKGAEANSEGMTDGLRNSFDAIGVRLYERYKAASGDINIRHHELVEDFLSVHGLDLFQTFEKGKEALSAAAETLLPLYKLDSSTMLKLPHRSILSILFASLNTKETNRLSVVQLLFKAVKATMEVQSILLNRINDIKKVGDSDDFSVSDDDSSMLGSARTVDEERVVQCGYFVALLIERIQKFIIIWNPQGDKNIAEMNVDFVSLIGSVQQRLVQWFDTIGENLAPEESVDLSIHQSISSLIEALRSESSELQPALEKCYLHGLIKNIISCKAVFSRLIDNPGNRASRASKLRICTKRANCLIFIASESALILSVNPSQVEDCCLKSAAIFQTDGLSFFQLQCLVDASLYLWKFASQRLSESPGSNVAVCSSFEKPLVRILRVPIATLILALCGSLNSSRKKHTESIFNEGDALCLSEFYDSDESANQFLQDSESSNLEYRQRRELLRVVCHTVQCINLVLEKIDDKAALSIVSEVRCTHLGPSLPLIAVRVLNHFADIVLKCIPQESHHTPDLWSKDYPNGARTIGEFIDLNLHKAYRWLYGFVIVGEKGYSLNGGKEFGSSGVPLTDLVVPNCKLEDLNAAAQLYRCVMRAYKSGRRSPPKQALELISDALPEIEENERSKSIRMYLFDANKSYFSLEQISKLPGLKEKWVNIFAEVRNHLVKAKESSKSSEILDESEMILRIRRGILSELASGQLQTNTNEKSKVDQTQEDDRISVVKHEEEIAKKFDAIVNDLCLGDASDSESWFRAAQIVSTKADIISDRLGLSEGFAKKQNFSIPPIHARNVRGISLENLIDLQEEEADAIDRVDFLGLDLSVYVRYSWACIKSLKACSESLKYADQNLMETNTIVGDMASKRSIMQSLDLMYQNGNILDWQEAWGGMFVCALRKLATRFLCAALFLLRSKETKTSKEVVLVSELYESLGTYLYSEIMGSQCFGYPMRALVTKQKRDIANVAKTCFQAAIDCVFETDVRNEDEEEHTTWDLLFMIGKCEEKIAATYFPESFLDGDTPIVLPRLYERHHRLALDRYHSALEQIEKIEEDGGKIEEVSGGSSHGRPEIAYRVLALRLKCLIRATTWVEDERIYAEEEALRLAERYWFKTPDDMDTHKAKPMRDRIWAVLADIVAGLVQCRLDNPFFHRSVYRHAQALMWTPILCNPSTSEGSLGCVPHTKSILIKGLNSSTSAAESAEIIMRTLFDKKRSQLCAVWLTTSPSPTPFELLNNSIRKYDSLRGKYISAYIEILGLCHRRAKLETILKWLSTAPRDLPGYFQASAKSVNSLPSKSHMNEPLLLVHNSLSENSFLTTMKRYANSAFAGALIHDMSTRKNVNTPEDKKKQAETDLKFAYATYLRLNCTKSDLNKINAWRYRQDPVREVDALCEAYLALGEEVDNIKAGSGGDFGDWSGGSRKSAIFDLALAKCKVLFPNVSPSFFSRRASVTAKSKSPDLNSDIEPRNNVKRKQLSPLGTTDNHGSDEMVSVSYEVAVPAGLSAGESFVTVVSVGGIRKQFKLTVPENTPSTLRFKTQVPKAAHRGDVSKKARLANNSEQSIGEHESKK